MVNKKKQGKFDPFDLLRLNMSLWTSTYLSKYCLLIGGVLSMRDDILYTVSTNAAYAARPAMVRLRKKSVAQLRRCLLLLACSGTFIATTCYAQQQTPGPWADVTSEVDETNVNVGLSLEGVDVTVLVGQVEIPVQSISDGNWNNPLDWSNVIVYYNDAQAVLDLANGELFTTNLNTLSTNLTFNQFMNQGPTQGGVAFPVPDPIPVLGETVHVNLGTNVIYDVNIANDITLDQNAVLNSLSIASGGNLDVNDQYSLSVGDGPIVNSGTISKTLGTGTFYFSQPVKNNGTIEVSSGTLWLTPTTTGLLEADPGGTMAIDNATLTGGAMTGGGEFEITGGSSYGYSNTTVANVNVHDTTFDIPAYNNLTAWGTWNNVTITPQSNGNLVVSSYQTLTLAGNSILHLQGGTVSGQLVNGGSSIIDGYGYEYASLTNNGTISADAGSSGTLYVEAPVTNNALIQDASSSTLYINTAVTNSSNGQIVANGPVDLNNATIADGAMTGGGGFTITGGSSYGYSNTTVANVNVHDTTFDIPAYNNLTAWGTWNNVTITPQANGNLVVPSYQTLTLVGNSTLHLQGGVISGQLVNSGSNTIDGYGYEEASLTNNGTISADAGGQTLFVEGDITNAGIIEAVNGATLDLTGANLSNFVSGVLTMGTYQVNANSTMNINGSILNNAATIILNGANTTFSAISSMTSNTGSFQLLNGASFNTVGNFSNSGNMLVNGGSTLAINGTLTNTALGTIIMDPSVLHVTGNFNTNGLLNLGLAGAGSGQYDQINVDGQAVLGGMLQISLMNNFAVQKGDTFNILMAQSGVTGNFIDSMITSGSDVFSVNYLPNEVTLTTVSTPEPNAIFELAAGIGGAVLLSRIRRNNRRVSVTKTSKHGYGLRAGGMKSLP